MKAKEGTKVNNRQIRIGLVFVLILFSLSVPGYCQEPSKHPIDKALEACEDKNPSTAGMIDCISSAYDKWDKELNRVYAELMKRLGPVAGAKLKEAQREWLKFRDSEALVKDAVFSKLDGTMYVPMHADSRMELIKNRAVELKTYLDLLKEAQ